MLRRVGFGIILALLLLGISTLIFSPHPVEAQSPMVYVLENNADIGYPYDGLTIINPANYEIVAQRNDLHISEAIGAWRAMAASDDGEAVVIAEFSADLLGKYDWTGNQLFQLTVNDVTSVDVAEDNSIYALTGTTIAGDWVLRFDSNGYLLDVGKPSGVDIVVDDDRNSVWVVGDKIKRLNKDLGLQFEVFPDPIGWCAVSVDFTSNGDAWVAEREYKPGTGQNRLLKISPDGDIIDTIPLYTTAPSCLSVDRYDDSFWVTSSVYSGNPGLFKYDANGNLIEQVEFSGRWSVKVNQNDGSAWVAGYGNISHYSEDRVLLWRTGISNEQAYVTLESGEPGPRVCEVTFLTDPVSADHSITFEGSTYYNGDVGFFDNGTSGPAVANYPIGWVFDHWETTGSVFPSPPQNPTTVLITGDGTLKAVFTLVECEVTFYTDPTDADYTIIFDGEFDLVYYNGDTDLFYYDTSASVLASAPEGWIFDHWETTSNVHVSAATENPTTVTITCGGTLKAVFSPVGYYVAFYTDPPAGPDYSITFEGQTYYNMDYDTFSTGTSSLATANAPEGWTLDHWEATGGVGISSATENPTTVTITASTGTLKAVFSPVECEVTFLTDPVGADYSITFEEYDLTYHDGETDVFYYGNSSLVTASAPEGWAFDCWEVTGNLEVSSLTENPTTVTITCGGTLKAVFSIEGIPEDCEITFLTDPVATGFSITFEGQTYYNMDYDTFSLGTSSLATANAPEGWTLDYWKVTGNVDVTVESIVTITGDGTLKAVFVETVMPGDCEVTFLTDPVGADYSITFEGQTYYNGDSDTFEYDTTGLATANAPEGWTLDYWETTGDVEVYDSTVTITCGGTLKAVFSIEGIPEDCEITFLTDPDDVDYSITFEGQTYYNGDSDVFDYGASGLVTASAPEGWFLHHWEATDNLDVSAESAVTVTGDGTLKAVFIEDNEPPSIDLPTLTPAVPVEGEGVVIEVPVDDASDVESVTLIYSVSGGEWEILPMQLVEGKWTATIPAQSGGTIVEYYIESFDIAGNYAESESFSYEVARQGIDIGVVMVATAGVAAATGAGIIIAKTGAWEAGKHGIGRMARRIRGQKLEPREEAKRERRRKRRKGKPKLVWSLTSPRRIRSGGHAYAQAEIKNVGKALATGVEMKIRGPAELKFESPVKVGDIPRNSSKNLRAKIECRKEVPEGRQSLTFTLTSNETPPQTSVRAVSFESFSVGLLRDSHNTSYLQKQDKRLAALGPLQAWLKENKYDCEVIREAEDIGALQKCDVVIASSQYALSNKDVASLKSYVQEGYGLVAFDGSGTIDADAFLKGEPSYEGQKRVYDLYGYSRPDAARIERGLKGIRIVENTHPITRGYQKGTLLRLPTQTGITFTQPVAKARVLADQRVSIEGKPGHIGVSCLTVRKFGRGRVVHFNFHVESVIGVISPLVEKAILWAANFER